jgi:hypothetical protein
MNSPAHGTLCSVRSRSPALAVCFSFNPFTNIGRAVTELNSIGFATRQKLYGITIQERYVFQVQNQQGTSNFQAEEALQFRDVFRLNSAAECEDNLVSCRSLDFQHDYPPSLYRRSCDSNPGTNVKLLKTEELMDPEEASLHEFAIFSRRHNIFFQPKLPGFRRT